MVSMTHIDVGLLGRYASDALAAVAAGESVTITEKGKPVARLSPITQSRLEALIASGRARPARRSIADLEVPDSGRSLSAPLRAMRDDER